MVQQVDAERVAAFGAQVAGWQQGAMLTLMLDLGHRTGLFEAAAHGPATSEELADRAGLTERYVREWLGAVTLGGIFTYDPATRTYTLPPEHAACLTGTTGRNLAQRAPLLAILGSRLTKVAACFRDGGGVPYAEYRPDYTDHQERAGRWRHDVYLLSGFLPLVPGLAERLTAGVELADIGCGTGHAANLIAQAFPRSRVVGYDIATDALERGRAEAASLGLTNVRYEALDLIDLDAIAAFDVITAFDVIHDQVDPATVLRRVHDALAPDGVFLMLDIKASSDLADNLAFPQRAALYAISTLHCMTVSLAEGGAGLGTMWGEQTARRMLADAGFSAVEVVDAPDSANSLYICRP
jgi:SAM-dependent methyltransferase